MHANPSVALHTGAKLIDGNAIASTMRAELAIEIAALKKSGVTPGLAVVLVGDNPASQVYVRMKGKACAEAGFYHETIKLRKETSEAELMALIERLNADSRIHGILVQLPLPPQIDTNRALHRIDLRKDVDGFHPENVGKVALGDPTGFRPATPIPKMSARSRWAIPPDSGPRRPTVSSSCSFALGSRRAGRTRSCSAVPTSWDDRWRGCCCWTPRAATRR